MVSSYCHRKPHGNILLQETAWYRHIVNANCMVPSHCYWKLDGMVILLVETARYRHIATGNWMVWLYCYWKLHGIVTLYLEAAR
jgi:hypothetical protein